MLVFPEDIIEAYKDFKPVSTKVYRIIKESLFTGQIPADSKLTEVAVAEALRCSRTPVRTALAKLRSEGLIQNLTKSNVGVREPETKDRLDLLALDELLEGEAVRLAALTGVPEDILDTLEELNDAMSSYHLGGGSPLAENGVRDLHMQFHLLIAKSSGNEHLYRAIVSTRNLMRALHSKAASNERNRDNYEKVLAPLHRKIIDAIRSRNPDTAQLCMRYELLLSKEIYEVADRDTNYAYGDGE